MRNVSAETTARCDCGKPSPDTFVCGDCATEIAEHLRTVPTLMVELATTHSRQDRLTSPVGVPTSGGSTTPLPWREHASHAIRHLHVTLTGWVRVLTDHTGGTYPEKADTPSAAAVWLLEHLASLRAHPAGGEAHAAMTEVVESAHWAIDRPPMRFYAGPCRVPGHDGELCPADLYGKPDTGIVRCPACGAEHDLAKRREWLLDAARDHLAHATEIARALPSLMDEPLSIERIWKWASRGRIVERARDRQGRPLYRIGDVIDLMASQATRT